MRSRFARQVLASPYPIPMPIGVYAGLEITGATVKDAVTNARSQTEAVIAMHERLGTSILLTAMDLSVESELFGCTIRMSDDEIPTVIGRKATSLSEIASLEIPSAGDGRSAVHLETAGNLVSQFKGSLPVLGGVIGPFSLAGRIFGVSEILELSLTDPDMTRSLLEKTTRFLIEYLHAFRKQGTDGVIVAEPAAGLLSPRGLAKFSSAFIRTMVEETCSETFTIVLHNCGARNVHQAGILESGAEIYHFGAPMDIQLAMDSISDEVILAGNLDPTAIFHNGTKDTTRKATETLMRSTEGRKNFIPSSGCDIPPNTPIENLAVFMETVRTYPPSISPVSVLSQTDTK